MKSKALTWIIISSTLAILVDITDLWDRVMSPDPDLVAKIKYCPFKYPLGLVESLPSEVPEPFSRIDVYWFIILENRGKKRAESVRLRLDNLVYVCIDRDDEKLVCNGPSEWIKIGDLHPLEEIQITAWSSSEPSFKYIADNIRIIHDSGIGTVLIQAPIDPFWHKLANFWPKIRIIIVLLILVVAIVWILDKLGWV